MTGAGKRNQRVTFQRKALDEHGDRLGDWEDDFSEWARVVPRTRGEVALEQRIQRIQPVEVFVLNNTRTLAVDNAWRMLWEGVGYNILAAATAENRAERTFLAQADQTDA